jgi:multiple sugar transport system permease protein
LESRPASNIVRRLRPNGPLAFVGPAVLTLLALVGFPIAYTGYMSLQDYSIASLSGPSFIGLANFSTALSQPEFRQAIAHTVFYTSLAVSFPVGIGILSAQIFSRPFRGRGVIRTIYLLPMMATPAAIALVWELMYNPQLGIFNYLLGLLHLPPSLWIFSTESVIPSLAAVEVWQSVPLMTLIILGGLATIDQDMVDAARVDGAGSLQIFRRIVIPQIAPYILVAIILRTIDALKAFDTIYIMTQGGPGTASETINTYLYDQAFSYYHIGYASAVVILFVLIILVVTAFLIGVRRIVAWR